MAADLGVTPLSAAWLGVTGAAVPMVVVLGYPMGLRADVLLAGFIGSMVAMGLPPGVERAEARQFTLKVMLAFIWDSARRVGTALLSAFVSGYAAPWVTGEHTSLGTLLFTSFAIGIAAQEVVRRVRHLVSNFMAKANLGPGGKPDA